jgi:PEP-CTERM motif-containing protein
MIQRTTVWVFVGVLAIATPRMAAADVITWDFTGSITGIDPGPKPGPSFGDLYPVGTPLTYSLTFDSTASPSAFCPSYYPTAIVSSSLTLGTDTFSGAGGVFSASSVVFGPCLQPGGPEFFAFGLLGGPIMLGPELLLFSDPVAKATGSLPTTQPSSAVLIIYPPFDFPNAKDAYASVTAAPTLPAVPEPTSVLLLGTGLAAIARKRIQRAIRKR